MIDLITLENSKYNCVRISSPKIEDLKKNEIFVFGSNMAGIHGAGAAKLAHEKFGAEWGVGEGLQGRSYAIPTKDEKIERLHLDVIDFFVGNFIIFAKENPDLNFLVTEIGCGLAGNDPKDIAPFFKQSLELNNVYLPYSFWFQLI